jgi:hypothetical protein
VCGWPITTTDRPGAPSIELPIALGALVVAVVRGSGKRAIRTRDYGAEYGQARPRRKLSCNFNSEWRIRLATRPLLIYLAGVLFPRARWLAATGSLPGGSVRMDQCGPGAC